MEVSRITRLREAPPRRWGNRERALTPSGHSRHPLVPMSDVLGRTQGLA